MTHSEFEKWAEQVSTAQHGQPSAFDEPAYIQLPILVRPVWLTSNVSVKAKMKSRTLILLALSTTLLGCSIPAGGVDRRFSGVPSVIVTELEYPVFVKIVAVDETLFDVEAGESRSFAVTGINQPLEQLARYEKAATIVLSGRVGDSYSIERVSYHQPSGFAKAFFRFRVTPRK